MSIPWDDDSSQSIERIRRKKTKPQGRRRLSELDSENSQDGLISRLIDLGHITEVVAELKSGKEATAYVARSPRGSALLKIYRDMSVRSFKNDAIYREGQTIGDDRAKRAMQNRSRKGLEMLQFDWVTSEYSYLWQFWRAGINVPEPLVGPNVKVCAETVPAVIMRLIGTEDSPAQRLSEARLLPEEAKTAWDQALAGMANILRLGYVHGDYSSYNLLWWENTVIIIDFPQISDRKNPNFEELLKRDAKSLSTSFRKHGVQASAEEVLQEVKLRSLKPAPEPRLVLP